MLLLVLAMSAAWLAAVTILRSALVDALDRRLEYSVSVLASGTLPLTPELLLRASLVTGLDFVLVDSVGSIMAQSGESLPADLEALTAPAGMAQHQNGVPGRTVAGNRVVMQPIAGVSVPSGSFLVAIASLDDVRNSVRRAGLWFAMTLLGAGLMLFLVGRRVSAAISRPIDRLGNFAERISAGERNIEEHLEGPEELQRLGVVMTSMAKRIDDFEVGMMRENRYKALGEMAARVAHEIKNPLTAIKLHLQLLQESADANERERLQRVLDETARLEMITANTLSVGADLIIETTPADLDTIAAEVTELLRPQFQHQHIDVTIESGCATPVTLDTDRAKQALLNILLNAADALEGGGKVRIATADDGECARISVEDDGPGISEEKKRDLFDKPASDKKFGLGLGLVVARQIAAAHGGTLRVMDSERLGGAKFVLEFPRGNSAESE